MSYLLDHTTGETLDNEAFYDDFTSHFWSCDQFWKLETAQHFAEPGNPSWDAFNQGNWGKALELHTARTEALLDYHEQCTEYGITTKRVRVVKQPVTPYLQWEMYLLVLRDATGGPIRILPGNQFTPFEKDCYNRPMGPFFPEVCGMDKTVMYEHLYDEHGVMYETIKYTDFDTITKFKHLTDTLYKDAEPIGPYFLRHIKPLPAPTITEQLPPDYLEQHGRPQPPGRT
jgi:hypothetical protein